MAYGDDFDATKPLDEEDPSITDFQRPSFGARIGGARSYPAIPKPAMPPADNTPAPSQPIQLDASKMPDILGGPRMPPPAPVGSSNPNLVDLLKQRAAVGTAIDPRIPGTSQTQPKYRMGLGSRILGGIADFGIGFSGSRTPPVYIGPGATNRQYEMDEAARQSKVANLDTQIKGQEQLDTENIRREAELQKAMYHAMLGQAAENRGTAALTTAGANVTKANAAQENADTKRDAPGKAPKTQVMGDRTMQWDDATGKWIDVGKAPTKQFAPKSGNSDKRQAAFDKIEAQHKKDHRDAEAKAQKEIDALPRTVKRFDPNDPTTPYQQRLENAKQEIYSRLEQSKAQAEADYQDRIREKGGTVNAPAEQNTVKTPPPNKVVQPGQGKNTAKVATQQHIAAYAQAKGITTEQAKQEFKASGYSIK